MNLLALCKILTSQPELSELLSYSDLSKFCDLVQWLRAEIEIVQPPETAVSPKVLPPHVLGFLATVLSLSPKHIALLWEVLRDPLWAEGPLLALDQHRAHALVPEFLEHGPAYDLGKY